MIDENEGFDYQVMPKEEERKARARISIKQGSDRKWWVFLKIENQVFPVGCRWDSNSDARWYARQLRVALAKIQKGKR